MDSLPLTLCHDPYQRPQPYNVSLDRFSNSPFSRMGRGGEKTVTPPSKSFHAHGHSLTASDLSRADAASTISSSVRPSKSLEAMPTEELRKKALQYGHDASADRASLLQILAPYGDILLRTDAPPSLPLAPPPFTLADIKAAVPRHCFERSLTTSFFHLACDLVLVALLGYLATLIGHPDVPTMSRYLLWPLYWYAQGSVLTGVWVIAHECGHQSFSPYERVNNLVGWVLHSALLVPYHSWRISHGKHHNNTGSCENDEVFAPPIKEDLMDEILLHSPLANLAQIIIMLTVGWMPGYLLMNATGPRKYKGKNNSHFDPNSALFSPKDRLDIIWSDIGFFLALAGVVWACTQYGFSTVGKYYLLPYMVVNYHLVLITYLQHTDVFIPHFRGAEWSWFRGALCTVDRSFGWLLDHTFHHISDTHVCHHIFSKMPFYHAQEASEHIKKALGPYYLKDDTPIWKALWRSYTLCKYVDTDKNAVFYKHRAS